MPLLVEVRLLSHLIFCLLYCSSRSFNIDLTSFDIRQGARGSYFGYSVAVHPLPTGDRVYLVGAPKSANLGGKFDYQSKLPSHRTGGLFRCAADTPGSDCTELDYGDKTNREYIIGKNENVDFNLTFVEVLDDSWFGVTIVSNGHQGGQVLGCGHRYAIQSENQRLGLGGCIHYQQSLELLSVSSTNTFFSPCYDKVPRDELKNPQNGYGMCQAGASAAVSGTTTLVLGMPGVKKWAGDAPVFSNPRKFGDFPSKAYLDVPLSKFSNLGASTAIGYNLLPEYDEAAYIYGAPRSNQTGHVVVAVVENGKNVAKVTLEGLEIGAQFGYAVTPINVTSTGRSALAVSAPFYSAYGTSAATTVGGAVFIYISDASTGQLPTTPTVTIQGPLKAPPPSKEGRMMGGEGYTREDCLSMQCTSAQFGVSVASAGDLNGDGYNELAVGAPYEGLAGAVYVFYGGVDGWSPDRMQKIVPSDLTGSLNVSGFGISLSGGLNMDSQQGYDDLLVGAHLSDNVILLRTRPVLSCSISYIGNQDSVIQPDSEDPCPFNPDAPISRKCFQYQICVKCSSSRAKFPVTIRYTVVGDAEQETNHRLDFDLDKAEVIPTLIQTLSVTTSDTLQCSPVQGYLKDRVNNYVSPLVMKIRDLEAVVTPPGPNGDINSYPIMNSFGDPPEDFRVVFERDCVTDACDTDLQFDLVLDNPEISIKNGVYTFDSQENDLEINLKITLRVPALSSTGASNSPAFETKVSVILPPELEYLRCNISSECAEIKATNRVVWQLSTPGKVAAGASITNTITLDSKKLGAVPQNITVTTTTTSNDLDLSNNVKTIKIREAIKTDLILTGSHEPDQTFYSGEEKGASSMVTEEDIGTLVQHTYIVTNKGPGRVSEVTVEIAWPKTVAGKHLLQLVSDPFGRSTCDIPQEYFDKEVPTLEPPPEEASTGTQGRNVRRKRQEPSNQPHLTTPGQLVDGEGEPGTKGESRDTPVRKGTVVTLRCNDPSVDCMLFNCTLRDFRPSTVLSVKLQARLWNGTLVALYGEEVDLVRIFSSARLIVNPALNIEQVTSNDRAEISTNAQPVITSVEPEGTPWWVILIAVTGGVLILIIVVVVLWKCGFFKRNRPAMYHEVKVEKQKKATQPKYEQVPQKDLRAFE